MPRLTAANTPALAHARRLFSGAAYAQCLRVANGVSTEDEPGVPGVLAYLERVHLTGPVTEDRLAAMVAALPDQARQAAATGARQPRGVGRV
jgi:hypothetical protein